MTHLMQLVCLDCTLQVPIKQGIYAVRPLACPSPSWIWVGMKPPEGLVHSLSPPSGTANLALGASEAVSYDTLLSPPHG